MQADKVSTVVIGAGVVGCAIAYELSLTGRDVIVLEKGPRIAEGVTSRNSGVIHAGIYYPPKSLKAESCIRGRRLLYEWCEIRGVPYRKTGKWIVGVKDEEETLLELFENAKASGAEGVRLASRQELDDAGLEFVKADIALYSETSGIVDAYQYSNSYRIAAEENGALFLMNCEVTAIERLSDGCFRLETSRGPIETELVVNAAGLHADEISRMAGVDKYTIYPWRGDYFRLAWPERKINTLIYPVKKKGSAGLGVHFTLGLDGSYRLGPDVHYSGSKTDFCSPERTDEKRRAFFEAAQRYFPGITEDQLHYDTCGIRPKLRSPADKVDPDFVLAKDLPGFINLMGIESPGLTASRDLAQRVAKLV